MQFHSSSFADGLWQTAIETRAVAIGLAVNVALPRVVPGKASIACRFQILLQARSEILQWLGIARVGDQVVDLIGV